MSGRQWMAVGLFTAMAGAGCQSARPHRPIAAAEPPLAAAEGEPPATVQAPAPPSQAVTFVDRHPLLSKPRDYYQNSGSNKIVKVGAATIVGIPAGVFGEMRQIVVGRPPQAY